MKVTFSKTFVECTGDRTVDVNLDGDWIGCLLYLHYDGWSEWTCSAGIEKEFGRPFYGRLNECKREIRACVREILS